MLLLPCAPLSAGYRAKVPTKIPTINLGTLDQQLIDKHIKRMTTRGRLEVKAALMRLGVFRPFIIRELRQRQLPNFLLYLPLAESSAKDSIVSSAGAAGLWQMMPATARAYGLRVDERVDERLHPQKSTQAALDLLQDLYGRYHDWALALAAYNCGTARVDRAIRRRGTTQYGKLRRDFPRQTRAYVPRFFAYVAVAQRPSAYHIKLDRKVATKPSRQAEPLPKNTKLKPWSRPSFSPPPPFSGPRAPLATNPPRPEAVFLPGRQRIFPAKG